jgi:hypothetical protein
MNTLRTTLAKVKTVRPYRKHTAHAAASPTTPGEWRRPRPPTPPRPEWIARAIDCVPTRTSRVRMLRRVPSTRHRTTHLIFVPQVPQRR